MSDSTKDKKYQKPIKFAINQLDVLVQYNVFRDEFICEQEELMKDGRKPTQQELNNLLSKFIVESINYAPLSFAAEPNANKFFGLLRLINEIYYGINSKEYFSINATNESPQKAGFIACYAQNSITLTNKSLEIKNDNHEDFIDMILDFSHEMSHYADDIERNYSRRKIGEVNSHSRFANNSNINELLGNVIDDYVSYTFYYTSSDEKHARDNSTNFADYYVDAILDNLDNIYKNCPEKSRRILDVMMDFFEKSKRYILESRYQEDEIYADSKGYQNQVMEKTGVDIKDYQQKIVNKYLNHIGLTRHTQQKFEEEIYNVITTIDFNENIKLYDDVKKILDLYRKDIGEISYFYIKNLLFNCGSYAYSKEELVDSIKNSVSSNSKVCFAVIFAKYFYIDRKTLVDCLFETIDIETLKQMNERELIKHLSEEDKKLIAKKFAEIDKTEQRGNLVKKVAKINNANLVSEEKTQNDKLIKYITNAKKETSQNIYFDYGDYDGEVDLDSID